MEEPINPYASGQDQDAYSNSVDVVSVSSEALATMLRIKFWVKLSGVAMFCIIALFLLSLFVMFAVGSYQMFIFGGIILLIPLIAIGGVATSIIRYSSALGRLGESLSSVDLLASMNAQRRFWRAGGIIVAVFTGLWFNFFIYSILGDWGR